MRDQHGTRSVVQTVFWELVLALLAAFFLLPILWMLKTSLMTAPQTVAYPEIWIPNPFTLRAFAKGLDMMPNFLQYYANTALITLLTVIGTALSSSLAAFGFARLWAPSKKIWFYLLMSTIMIPGTVTLIPTFVLYSKLHWVDTFLPLVLPSFFGGTAFNIFLLRQFFSSLPKDLGESALIDGCSWLRIYGQIYLPNARPALLVVIMFTFVATWNDYMGPLIYLTNPQKFTLSIGLNFFKNQYGGASDLGPLMAMALLSVLPILILYLACQKYFVEGIVTTGIKG